MALSKAIGPLERLVKWRVVFAGWQLGTRYNRDKEDPEAQAVRDHREVTMIMRAEISALVALLVEKGVITEEEFDAALAAEAEQLSEDFSKRFPGMRATDIGITVDIAEMEKHGTMRGWLP